MHPWGGGGWGGGYKECVCVQVCASVVVISVRTPSAQGVCRVCTWDAHGVLHLAHLTYSIPPKVQVILHTIIGVLNIHGVVKVCLQQHKWVGNGFVSQVIGIVISLPIPQQSMWALFSIAKGHTLEGLLVFSQLLCAC